MEPGTFVKKLASINFSDLLPNAEFYALSILRVGVLPYTKVSETTAVHPSAPDAEDAFHPDELVFVDADTL